MADSPYLARPWLKHYDFWVPAEVRQPHGALYQILQIAASQYASRPATHFHGAELTFWQIKQQVDRLAAALHRRGIRAADRVGIMLPNCPQYPISFFAIARLGAIVVNINPLYTAPEVARVIEDSGLCAMVTLDTLASTARAAGAPPMLILSTLAEYKPECAPSPDARGALAFTRLIAESGDETLPRLPGDCSGEVAVLTYTGGTTGVPKGAMLTHGSIYVNMLQSVVWGQYFTRRGEERLLLVLPLFHVYGMTVGMLLSFWNGTLMILMEKYNPDQLLDAVERLRPTFLPGVPTMFQSILNHPRAATCGLEHVKSFNSGAAPLAVETIDRFERLSGAMLREGYGMTELSCSAITTPLLGIRKPGSIGVPMPSTWVRIVDLETATQDVPVGEEGELLVRGPQMMSGYWRKPEETANTIRDGWLHTGDIARMDQDGYFYIVQRKKDMINVGGFKVFPTEVDEVLYAHPAVAEAAAVGIPHPYRGEVVKAYVVLRAGSSASAAEILEFCGTRLAKFKAPAEIEFLDSLPKSAVGKILRKELRRRADMDSPEQAHGHPATERE
ncbi:MAG: long-chain fatty acid--CoA ligase [Bryobacterales bacterium]|nr:long-chain fatty acid--CoA ligase [Bryobacterales bacterium]